MMSTKIIIPAMTAVAVGLVTSACCKCDRVPSEAEDEAKIASIIKEMTLEEKVSLLAGDHTMSLRAIPRVGINHSWKFTDSSHTLKPEHNRWDFGYVEGADDTATVLPPLAGLGATWNVELAAAHGKVMGEQARARGKDMLLGPGINIMRTPLCGRNWEYLTEDPYLASRMVVPLIQEVQKQGVAACVKHYAANNQELNRTGVNVVVDERTLREIYLPAFRAAVQEGGALTVMNSYSKFRGVFCSANNYLQNEILRGEWGFKGFVVTDWGAMHDTVEAANNGCDVEMNCGDGILYYTNPHRLFDAGFDAQVNAGEKPKYVPGAMPLVDAVRVGKVKESQIDVMVGNVLRVMFRVGAFGDRPRSKGRRHVPEHAAVARAIGEEAIVLLKNDNGVLPLDAKKMRKVLVIGNLVDGKHCMGGWSAEGKPLHEVTPFEGLRERLGDEVEIVRAPLVAADLLKSVKPIPEKCLNTFDETKKGEGFQVRAWHAEYFKGRDLVGEPVKGFLRALNHNFKFDPPAAGLEAKNYSCRWKTRILPPETGRYVLVTRSDRGSGTRIYVDGKLVMDDWNSVKHEFATGEADLEAGREAEVVVEYRTGEAGSVIDFEWQLPSERGMSLAETKTAARECDAVLVFTGTSIGHGRALECEGGDRPNMLEPEGHDEAIAEILSWNIPNTVVINHSGSPMEMPWANECATLVQQPYLGQEAGRPLAAVLFGDVNPSGKLPCTWPVRLADTGVAQRGTYTAEESVYNERFYVGYRWFDHMAVKPLFPFGFGLSYTKFQYEDAVVSSTQLGAKDGDAIRVKVAVKNIGERDGKEIVQLYVASLTPKVERCEKELRGFRKLGMKAGETATAEMAVSARDLAYYDVEAKKFRADKGKYRILIGASSRDIKSVVDFELTEDWIEK